MTTISCAQLAPDIDAPQANREQTVAAVRAASEQGADIVVLPELATSGYLFRDRAEARAAAVPRTHSVLTEWARVAGSAVVVGGFCELGADGVVYNSAAVVDRTGVLAVYRKIHLWDREKLIFAAGDEPPPVLDTVAGRIGVLICYDLEFPEMTRSMALAGAGVLAVPTNWPLLHRPEGEHPPEVVIAMATARMNGMVVACCDRDGTERGQRWTGGTAIVDSDGWVVARADKDSTALAEVDLERTLDKRRGEFADLLGDRRPGCYSAFGD